MSIELWTLTIALLTAVTCSMCGVFLVVKREALVSEGLSHAVLPGITIAYVFLNDSNSPWLLVGASLTGLLMVLLVRALQKPISSIAMPHWGSFSRQCLALAFW